MTDSKLCNKSTSPTGGRAGDGASSANIVTSEQSSGKSTLLAGMSGCISTAITNKPATRCPVTYKFLNDSESSREFNGIPVKDDNELGALLSDHMKSIEGFSTNPVVIEIRGPSCRDFSIIDVPGFHDVPYTRKFSHPEREGGKKSKTNK